MFLKYIFLTFSGNPAALYDRANPDWAPTLKLTGNLSSKKSDKKIQESTTSVKRYSENILCVQYNLF